MGGEGSGRKPKPENVLKNNYNNLNENSVPIQIPNYSGVQHEIRSGTHNITTDDLNEGSSNLYFTNARVHTAGDSRYVNVTGDTMTGALNVNSTLYSQSTFTTDGGISVDAGNVDINNGTLDVSGTTTLRSATTIIANLDNQGEAKFQNGVEVDSYGFDLNWQSDPLLSINKTSGALTWNGEGYATPDLTFVGSSRRLMKMDVGTNTIAINQPPSIDSNTRLHVYDNTAEQMFIGETNQTGQGVEALQFYQNPTTPTDNMGILNSYYIKDSAGAKIRTARLQFAAGDVTSGTVDGNFGVFLRVAGTEKRVLSMSSSSTSFNDANQDIEFYIYANSGVVPSDRPLAIFHGGTGDIKFGDVEGFFINEGSVLTTKPRVAGDNALKLIQHSSQSGNMADFSGGTIDANGDYVAQSYTNATRPSAGTAGRIIFNTDDGQLNVDDGTNWTLPDGTTT